MTQRHGGIIGKDYDAAKQTTTTFTSNGLFTPHTTQDVSFLCIGGGGAGAGSDAGSGGGGAGGYRSSFNSETSGGGAAAEDPLALTKGTDYQIIVGDGGVGGDETHYHYGLSPQRQVSGTSRGFGDGHQSSIGGISDSYTKLMLRSYAADGNTTFTDLSQNSHTITVTGNVHHEIDQQKEMHPTAIYFDGTGDHLQLPTSSDWALGTGDFTIECWFRQDASPSGKQAIFDTRVSGRDTTTGFSFGIHNNGSFYLYNNGDIPVTSGGDISANTWYHIAAVRDGGVIIMYMDGKGKQTTTPSERNFTDTQAKIGRRNDTDGELFKGYLDELRVSKGIARYGAGMNYSTNFDAYTSPYSTNHAIISFGGGRSGSQASGHGSGWKGGSGGGGTYTSGGGFGIEQQGYNGGTAKHFGGSGYGGGGGGGASEVGGASSGTNSGGSGDVGGDGGAGRASTITGSSVTRAGGGGGGHRLAMTNAAEPGAGGAGGGGAGQGGGTHGTNGTGGTQGDGVDATANTGGGGGGSGGQNQSQYGRISDTGGDGGSGIVVMYEPAANSGVWNMDDVFRYVSDGKW